MVGEGYRTGDNNDHTKSIAEGFISKHRKLRHLRAEAVQGGRLAFRRLGRRLLRGNLGRALLQQSTPLQYGLLPPDLQQQSRGTTAYLTGVWNAVPSQSPIAILTALRFARQRANEICTSSGDVVLDTSCCIVLYCIND